MCTMHERWKHYPKDFKEATTVAGDGYTIYRHQNNGQTATLADGTVIDNKEYCAILSTYPVIDGIPFKLGVLHFSQIFQIYS